MEILGLAMIYFWIHFVVVQAKRGYQDRTPYEKIVTWVAIVSLVLFMLTIGALLE